jgi:glycosyltransferase XagB
LREGVPQGAHILTAHLYQFAANREAELLPSGKNIAAIEELPLVSAELLDGMFERLSTEDKKLALQNKIIPVACLPKMTLHGAAGHAARVAAEAAGLHIIAQIDPIDFARAIRRKLGKEVLAKAANALRIKNPTGSAHRRFTPQQTFWAAALVVLMAYVYNCMRPEIFYAGASLICGIFFLTVISLRVLCLFENKSAQTSPALVLTVDELPVYSILVPVFRETQVLNQLIASLSHLNYPRAKLDIKLILEETDIQMQRAVAALVLPEYFDVIVVPTGKPQTKPRALNYALQFARGTLLTIYDAEDVPEPLQLRKAAAQFAAAPASLACLQAELAFYNANENWLTSGIRAQMPQGFVQVSIV